MGDGRQGRQDHGPIGLRPMSNNAATATARYVNADEARGLLSLTDSLALVETAFTHYGNEGKVTSNPSASYMIARNDTPTMFWMKGAVARGAGATGVFFGAQFGDYYFAVCDSVTGRLRGIVEQAWLTKRRTAATGVVAARHLAGPDVRIAALIGAGHIGEEVIRVLAAAFELDQLRVASRTFDGAAAVVQRLQPEVRAPLRAMASAEEAIRGAQVVITITLATAPFVRAGWLAEGAVLVSMGGVHEVDFEVLHDIDRLVVDDPGYALLRGDFAAWIDRGEISQDDLLQRVDAHIGEVVAGQKPGRTAPGQRIMAVIQGMAICDLIVAQHLLARAAEAGLGQSLTIGPQMEVPGHERMKPRSDMIAAGLARRRG